MCAMIQPRKYLKKSSDNFNGIFGNPEAKKKAVKMRS